LIRGGHRFFEQIMLHQISRARRRAQAALSGAVGQTKRELNGEPAMVDLSRIDPGMTGTAHLVVGLEHTAPFVGSGHIAVLATPVMINLIEAAALNAAEHLLPSGHQSLGIHLDVSHVAATPIGLAVTATAEVVRVEGRTITFRVEARDTVETIGSGTHQRVVVSVSRFDERVRRKAAAQKRT
jgi:fluoroacetyl-CoA thioesterase